MSMRGNLAVFFMLVLISIAACSSSSDDGNDIIDTDADLFNDETDNCPLDYNPDQMASIGSATLLGDVCDDEDEDAIVDLEDNCPLTSNTDQTDTNGDGVGDACELCRAVSLAADIWTGAGSGDPGNLTELNGRIFFRANDGISGDELWEYDPVSGANLVAEIMPGSGGSNIYPMWALNGKLFFDANDGVHGRERWTYDPTDSGAGAYKVTQEVIPRSGIELDGKQYFFRDYQLWAYDLSNPSAACPYQKPCPAIS